VEREIKALQKINNPNVIRYYEHGTFTDQGFEYLFIIMEFADGQPLTNYVGTLDEDGAVRIIKSLVSTLDGIHLAGIIHRDLKPANIMMRADGSPVVLDFGLALLIDYSRITPSGSPVGSYAYMSPEQVTSSHDITPVSDYFSVGVIFYELLTGEIPYDAANLPALIEQIKNRYPPMPSDANPAISANTEAVILKLLEKQEYNRYQSVKDVIAALDNATPPQPKKLDLSIKHIIRSLHNEGSVVLEGIRLGFIDSVEFPANFLEKYANTAKKYANSGARFVVDPATTRLTYSAFSKTQGVVKLPYSSGSDVDPLQRKNFDSITDLQKFVKEVLEYQVLAGVTELAAPYFFAKDPSDPWFTINLHLLKEAIAYRDGKYKNLPIWGGICMNIEGWHDNDIKDAILTKYTRVAPDGFLVNGDPVGRSSNLPQLYHYADLLVKLQSANQIPVVSCRTNGGLGMILLAAGVAGISSGVSALDSFSESILSDSSEGYASGPRYYIPELLSMISLEKGIPTKLRDIEASSQGRELKCPCEFCESVYSKNLIPQANIKMHFLLRKHQQINELKSVPPKDRMNWVKEKLDRAIAYEKILRAEGIKLAGDFGHLQVWKQLAEKF
jgi:serine/threonine-protein kinase